MQVLTLTRAYTPEGLAVAEIASESHGKHINFNQLNSHFWSKDWNALTIDMQISVLNG